MEIKIDLIWFDLTKQIRINIHKQNYNTFKQFKTPQIQVHILPKHPHIKKKIKTHVHMHAHTHTHTHAHMQTHTHTHPHVLFCQTKHCCCVTNFQIHQFLLKWWGLEALFVAQITFLPRSRASCRGTVPWGFADCDSGWKRSVAVSSNSRNSFTTRDVDPTRGTSIVICHWGTA
jgi:hypothetical protein